MNKENQHVWTGIEDKTADPEIIESGKQEFFDLPIAESLTKEKTLDLPASRRDFLKYLGFGIGAATVAAGCDIPVKRAIPYVVKPDEIVPGVANYYASSFVNGGDYCSILVKTREGRPIKIEGNAMSPITKGGTSARTQALVLSLYDTNRFTTPGKISDGAFEATTWDALDNVVKVKLNENAQVRILTNTVMSPSTKHIFKAFTDKYPNTKVVSYDPVSSAAMLEANEQSFGLRMIPDYRFDKADVIVSFNADFLGTWISPIEYARQYVEGRKIKDVNRAKMSRHIQVESGMSLTGSNADNRIMVKPSEQGAAIAALHDAIASKLGKSTCGGPKVNPRAATQLAKVAKELIAAAGRSLVVCGNNNLGEHLLVNRINDMLGNYGNTLSFANASLQRQGSDKDVQALLKEMQSGRVDVLIVYGANPAFDLPNAGDFKEAMGKVKLKVSTALLMDETTAACDWVAPDHHLLESWGDVQPKRGHYSIIQPTISPLFDTRQAQESLLVWAGDAGLNRKAEAPYYEYLKAFWKEYLFPQNGKFASFQSFWDNTLHDGVVNIPATELKPVCSIDASSAAAKLDKPLASDMEVSFFESINIGAGQYNNNPWLQELPDPVTRCVWGNYLTVPIEWKGGDDYQRFNNIGANNKYGELDLVQLDVNGNTQTVGAIPQFGQMPGTASIALGYGREVAGRMGQDLGQAVGNNVYPYLSFDKNGNTRYYAAAAVSEIVGKDELASVQYHHTMGVTSKDTPDTNVDEAILAYQGALTDRSIIFNSHVDDLKDFVHDLKEKRAEYNHLNEQTLYPFDEYTENIYKQGHHWGMFIDLNACIGCGACAVSCMAENNVPVVGKHEVYRHHEMFWIQIDRYYYGDIESPNTVYQPRMCQHCDNAPCENVCPVAATNHSSEGLNQMAYNRCVGTRYCANNCPYKVRRFNWLDYTTADIFPINQPEVNGEDIPFGADNLTRMVLNPDVTVRVRGVIEKCSFCVQRLQTGKLTAKAEGRKLRDADVKTACQTACPTGAIVFGDQNNESGDFSKHAKSPLVYRVLEEVNTQSSVYYTAKIHNRDMSLDA